MLNANERLLKIATADAKTLARVDAVLLGEDTATATFCDEETRTTTFTDTARQLGVSRMTVYQLVRAGRLDALTVGSTNRITVKSIKDFANGKRPADAATVERMKATARTRTANLRNRCRSQREGKRGAV